jgi:hypothetical protein
MGPPLSLGPAGVTSGEGQCENDPKPSCTDSPDYGPLPTGEYNMNADDRPGHENYWRLEPTPSVSWWEYRFGLKRSGFLIHPGSRTTGCVNAEKLNQKAMGQYNRIYDLLKSEQGSNYLTVEP